MLVVFSGVSGVGKNTIIQKLLDKHDNMHFFKSATTRSPRPGETIYDFYSDEEFQKKRENGDFLEVENSHGFWYATQMSELAKIEQNPQNVYVKDIDVHGAEKLKKYFEGKGEVYLVFVDAPDEVIHQRLIDRGESEERAQIRLSRGKMEREYIPSYDFVVSNIDLDNTVTQVENFIFSKLEK